MAGAMHTPLSPLNIQIVNKDMDQSLIAEMSETLKFGKSLEDLVRRLLTMLELATDLESTYLTKIDLEAGEQKVLFSRNSQKMQIPEGLTVPWGDTLCKRALEEGRLCADDVANRWQDSEAARLMGITTYVSSPVYLDDGSLYGTLCAASSERKPLTSKSEHVLRLFAELIAQNVWKDLLMSKLEAANSTLTSYSYTDALTGLLNRRAVFKELDRVFSMARRLETYVMVTFIDLDGFKEINDRYGHDAGDEFLIQISRRLEGGARKGDIVGRIGGDEFVIAGLGPSLTVDIQDLTSSMKDRLSKLIEGEYALSNATFDYPGASLGVIAINEGESTPDEALKLADAAMYREKRARKNASGER